MTEPLKAPFPYPGGKSKVADLVWERLGNVDNYVEPFCGTLATLLRRPAEHFADGYRVETVNDANHYLVNFWRAVKADPEAVAAWCDWQVTETDLHARHKWLVRSREADEWRAKMVADPDHYDAKVAGWWVWGQCCWIGGAWCNDGFVGRKAMPQIDVAHGGHRGPREGSTQVPDLTSGGCGIHAAAGAVQIPELSSGVGRGIHAATGEYAKLPELSSGVGRGVAAAHGGRPQLTDAFDIGRGVNANGNLRADETNNHKRPELSDCGVGRGVHGEHAAGQVRDLSGGFGGGVGVHAAKYIGTCDARRAWLIAWMQRLSDRLRLVRTCYGHWSRVCDSDSTLTRLGVSGVFLDPPYPANRGDDGTKSREANLYANDKLQDLDALRDEVLDWCRRWGGNPLIRVAVCGYEGDGYEALESEGWRVHAWEANGGYANQRRAGKGKAENARRERIWFSPACVFVHRPVMASLFAEAP